MKKKIRKLITALAVLFGILITEVTPVFAGQVGQSFRFTLKNRTNIRSSNPNFEVCI